jgi:hypothetical protein
MAGRKSKNFSPLNKKTKESKENTQQLKGTWSKSLEKC